MLCVVVGGMCQATAGRSWGVTATYRVISVQREFYQD